MMSSSSVNGHVIKNFHQNTNFGENDFGEDIELDMESLTAVMETVSDQVKAGNLSNLEEILVCQTYSLQHLFMTMASKISGTTNPDHIDLFARFALKAQNQCRSTIATLSEMKNPKRATFIKQQNNAVNQQINQNKNSKILINLQTNYWSKHMANGWTQERRKKQSELIKTWEPWKRSTGAKTTEGSDKSKMNALKHGCRSEVFRKLYACMAAQNRIEREIRREIT